MSPDDAMGWVGALIVAPLGFVIGLICVIFRRRLARNARRGSEELVREDLPRWMRGGDWSAPSAIAILVTGILMMIASALAFLYPVLHLV